MQPDEPFDPPEPGYPTTPTTKPKHNLSSIMQQSLGPVSLVLLLRTRIGEAVARRRANTQYPELDNAPRGANCLCRGTIALAWQPRSIGVLSHARADAGVAPLTACSLGALVVPSRILPSL